MNHDGNESTHAAATVRPRGPGSAGEPQLAGAAAAAGAVAGLHVVVGAGPIGSGIARALAAQGHEVRLVTRSGSAPRVEADELRTEAGTSGAEIELAAADASDISAMARLTDGAAVLYNCANPAYHRWPELWPPIAAALLGAAERSGLCW